MSCELHQRIILELGFDAANRQRIAAALSHLEECEQCRKEISGADRIAALIGGSQPLEAVPTEGWASFDDHLIMTISNASTCKRSGTWTRFSWAVAASLLVGILGLVAGLSAWWRAGHANSASPVVASLSDAEIAQRISAFKEINQVFDGRAGWVLLSGKQSDMGVSAVEGAIDQRPLLVRLRLSRQGQFVCNADVLIAPGQMADLTLPTTLGSHLRCKLVTFANDASKLALRAELHAAASKETQALLTTNLELRGHEPISVGQLVTPGGTYELSILFALPQRVEQGL